MCYCEYWKLSVAWTIHTFAFMMMAIRFVLSLEASLGEWETEWLRTNCPGPRCCCACVFVRFGCCCCMSLSFGHRPKLLVSLEFVRGLSYTSTSTTITMMLMEEKEPINDCTRDAVGNREKERERVKKHAEHYVRAEQWTTESNI